ncbi:MAG: SiaB family protein kinase [Putridiphycobacter sp.]
MKLIGFATFMIEESKLVQKYNARFQEIFGKYNMASNGRVIVSHFGEFSQELVNSLSVSVEDKMKESGDKKGIVKRMFSILVEGLQNIRIHGERDENGGQVSFLVILQEQEKYKVAMSNLVNAANIDKITARIDELNQMELPEIKELYMEVLSNGIMSNKGGAGLGFITMVLKSKNRLEYISEEIQEGLYALTLEVTLDRKTDK